MCIDELLEQVNNTLTEPKTPQITDEVLQAIHALGEERDEAREEVKRKENEIIALKGQLASLDAEVGALEYAKAKAENKAKEMTWVANELGKFVRDVASRAYEGKEIAAAQRVYDLNNGSLAKHRVNAFNFDSLADARKAFSEQRSDKTGKGESEDFLTWLYSPEKHP